MLMILFSETSKGNKGPLQLFIIITNQNAAQRADEGWHVAYVKLVGAYTISRALCTVQTSTQFFF